MRFGSSDIGTRAREHESMNTRARALEHSSTRALINTRAREHEPEATSKRYSSTSKRYSSTSTRARARGALEHEHSNTSTRWLGNQCEPSGEWHAKPVGQLFNHMGLHAPGWLYVLGMPPRGYLPFLATLSPQSTCHGPRRGPTLAPWCAGRLPACPGAKNTRKDPRQEEKKMPM